MKHNKLSRLEYITCYNRTFMLHCKLTQDTVLKHIDILCNEVFHVTVKI